jgi:uncharacterized membrane protein YuzA (DUF378 family)
MALLCVISVFTLICLAFLYVTFLNGVFALSPSFPRQEIKDIPLDWRDIDKQKPTDEGSQFTDIRRVNYFSDGKYLNATLWLRGNIVNGSENGPQVSYGMFIDGDSKTETGWQGVDYQTEISWQNGTWMSTVAEFSSLGDVRILDSIKLNNTELSKSMGNYVPLSLDLRYMIFPEKYKVIFYAGEIKKDDNNNATIRMMDFTNWVHLPTPEFIISTKPSSIELRPGEQKTILVNVNSTTGFEPVVNFSAINLTDVGWKLRHNHLLLPSYGLETIPLQIKVSENATVGPYLLNMFANATFPSESLIDSPSSEEEQQQFIIPQENERISKQTSIGITVREPLTVIDHVSEIWGKLGGFINFVYLIGGAAATWLFTTYIKKREKKNDNNPSG